MKLHEYQAKGLLASYGVTVPRGGVAATPQEAEEAARHIGARCAVKAQVHAGGRGKAGGIRIVETPEEAARAADSMLGKPLVTAQTGPKGLPVNRVWVEEVLDVERELYFATMIDGTAEAPLVVASRAGGIEIEEFAKEHPGLVLREVVDPVVGLQAYQGRRLAVRMGLPATIATVVAQQMIHLYQAFIAMDCSLLEVNPLVITRDGRVVALDAKVNLDDDALFRHPDLVALRDWTQSDPLEAEAIQSNIAYVKLGGDVGCLVNGAGLAMATMDIVKRAGCEPANFLDVGGGADSNRVALAMSIILRDPQVTRVLVNVFGGISRCDEIAWGIVLVASATEKHIPIVVRLMGTKLEEGRRILERFGLDVYFVGGLSEAARVLEGLGPS